MTNGVSPTHAHTHTPSNEEKKSQDKHKVLVTEIHINDDVSSITKTFKSAGQNSSIIVLSL